MKEALKLAQRALSNKKASNEVIYKALHAIKEALAQPEHSAPHGEPVAWVTKRNVIVDGLWEEEITFSEFDDGGDPVYYTPPQRTEERNFCPRCGKRTADLTVIHTCTPPQEKNT